MFAWLKKRLKRRAVRKESAKQRTAADPGEALRQAKDGT